MSSRRTFLAITSASLASPVSTSPAIAVASEPYDFAAIDARIARPSRHKQVFAVARVADGNVVSLMSHGIDAYEKTMGEGPGTMHAAAVFYSRGVVLGLSDAMWHRYHLAEHARRRGETLTATVTDRNPFGKSLAELQTRGATLFVCDNALADWATYLVTIGGFTATTPEELRGELRRNVLPGAFLVPAGVAALNATQEARFTFVQASL